jgi:hypothetical protein
MTEAESPPLKPKRDFLATAAPWAETFSKAVAGIAIALYASGFLIVSLYHSKYGFVGTNPFRPRVLAAGAWFFFFTAIPVSVAVTLRKEPWLVIASRASFYWITFFAVSMPFGNLLFDYSPLQISPPFSRWTWVFLLAALGAIVALDILARKKKAPQWVPAILSVFVTAYFAWYPLRGLFTDHHFDTSSLTLWFFATTFIVKLEIELRADRNLAEYGEWSKPLAVLFGFLLVFSREIYPHLKTSWGGGTATNVTIYFTKDSLLSPSKPAQVQLVEESDEGFYVVGPKESKAVFVPRGAVALVYFGDKTTDSPLLQGNK